MLDEDYFSEIKSGTVMQIRKQIKTKQVVSKENDNDEDIEINHTNNLPRLQICLPGDLIKHDDLVKVMGKVCNMLIETIIFLFISGLKILPLKF